MAISFPSSSYLRPHRRPCAITDPVLPDELVREILSWLPVKSLMRFKSVCRIWRLIILDPDFARVHQLRGAFKGLLISDSFGERRAPATDFYYMTPEAPTNQIIYQVTVTAAGAGIGETMGRTNQVNGLVCFYYRNRSLLYNVATRESLRLPDSVDESRACSYHLGFDPVNKLYKLVKICPIYDGFDGRSDDSNPMATEGLAVFRRNSNCEILTFGEGVKDAPLFWRNISPPAWEILSQSLCYNGVLYWMERVVVRSCLLNHLIAFDLSEERFFIFPLPHGSHDLAQFGPCLCVYAYEDFQFVIRSYYCGKGGGRGELVTPDSELKLPSKETNSLYLVGILPNGKLLLRDSYDCIFPDCGYYLYDPSNGAFGNIVIPRLIYSGTTTPSPNAAIGKCVIPRVIYSATTTPSLSFVLDVRCTSYYEENILSPRALISKLCFEC